MHHQEPPSLGRRRLWTCIGLWLAALAPFRGSAANPPSKAFRVFYLPPAIVDVAVRIDDRGDVFGVKSVGAGGFTHKTTFYIYRPSRDGNHVPGVQTIPGPVTGWMGSYGIQDINQKGQFIVVETSPGYDHRFVWDGGAFVEVEDPRVIFFPEIKGRSDEVVPTSVHDDGSIWGVAAEVTKTGQSDFGGIVSWDLGGNPTVQYAFQAGDDLLRLGSPRNEKGVMLRYRQSGLTFTDTVYWDGTSAATGDAIPHPPSTVPHLNDRSEAAGIALELQQAWINLPAAAYGLSAGFHLLPGVKVSWAYDLAFDNAGQIVVVADDGTFKLWEGGTWYDPKLGDPIDPNLHLAGVVDGNALGTLLGYVREGSGPGAPVRTAILTPVDLSVTATMTPTEVAVGDDFDLQLQIQNHMDIPLKQVGIVVPSMFLTGDLIANWVKAPPALLNLAPGAIGTLHYGFRATGNGKVKVWFQVQGLDAGGVRRTLTESFSSPEVTVSPPLDIALTPDSTDVEIDEEFDVTAAVHNASKQKISGIQLSPANLTVEGTGTVEFKSGPIPPLVSTLEAGTRQAVKLRFKAKQAGAVLFKAAALGKRTDGSDVTSLVATSRVVRIGIKGDLLINRVGEPEDQFALDDVYQKVPADAQSRTNIVGATREASFRIRIQNDSKLPRTYRLSSFEDVPGGWDVAYLFGNADVTAAVRSGTGFELPELASHEQTEVRATLKLTNAVPGDPKRVTLALSSPLAPNETLDAVEAVARLPEVDLLAIEVNQVVQDWRNSVTLIAGKPTFVRVFLQLQPGTHLDRPVKGRLRAYRGDVELDGSPLSPRDAALTVPGDVAAQRGDFESSMNFDLPLAWTQGTVKLQFEPLDFKARNREPAEAGGQEGDGIVKVTFGDVPDLPIVVHRVFEYLNSGLVAVLPSTSVPELIRRIETVFPVRRIDWHEGFRPSIFAREIPKIDDFEKINSQVKADASYLNCASLADCALHLCLLRYRAGTPTDPGMNGGGLADAIPSSIVTARQKRDTFVDFDAAHELGHAFGREHAILMRLGTVKIKGTNYWKGVCGEGAALSAPEYPYFDKILPRPPPVLGPLDQGADRMIYGYDKLSDEIISPTSRSELMSYCDPLWISDYTYRAIHDAIVNRFGVPPSPPPKPQGPSQPVLQMVLRGTIDDTSNSASLLPLRNIVTANSAVMPGTGPYHLEVLGAGGAVTATYDFRATDNTEDIAAPSSFYFVVPQPEELQGLRVRRDQTVLLTRNGSAHAPVVQLVTPNGGEQLASDDVTLRWEASDADGDALSYVVEFSPDNGANWNALAVDLPDTELTVPRNLLRGTTTGLIRVEASDGLLTATDTSDARFTVADNPPQVFAIFPADGSTVARGARVLFEATAFDAEDGGIPEAKLKWSSNLDGDLGTGLVFDRAAADLQLGTHLITLTATDTAGHTSTTTASLRVVKHRPARLGVPRLAGDGRLEFEVFGSIGATNVIQTSTNLTEWKPASTRIAEASVETISLDLPATASPLFIRVVTD